MDTWKKIVLQAAGFGGGFALAASAILVGGAWYQSRPEKLDPWNEKAIIATFDFAEAGPKKSYSLKYSDMDQRETNPNTYYVNGQRYTLNPALTKEQAFEKLSAALGGLDIKEMIHANPALRSQGESVGSAEFEAYYTLENTTAIDFRISPGDLELHGRLKREKSLTGKSASFTLEAAEVFIPARQRARFVVHLHYPVPDNSRPATEEEDRRLHGSRQLVANSIREKFPNLDGFVVFHQRNRHQINLPSGWDHVGPEQ